MSEQNLLGIEFDVNKLDESAKKVLSIVQDMYAKLENLDNKKISPIGASGLTELITAVKEQKVQIDGLVVSLSDLGLAMREYNKTVANTASNTAKLAVLESEAGVANMKSKVALQEKTKAIKEQVKGVNELMSAKEQEKELNRLIAEEEKKNLEIKKQQDIAYQAWWRQQLRERDLAEEERIAKEKEAAAIHAKLLKEKEAADNKEAQNAARISAEEQRNAAIAGRNMLAQNDLFKELKKRQAELRVMYTNSLNNNSPKEVQNALAAQLQEANRAVDAIDSQVDRIAGGGGIKAIGKELTSSLGLIRQLAYILPGIGIAGLFNLAFEAIQNAANALGLMNNQFERTIDYQDKLTKSNDDLYRSYANLADIFAEHEKFQVQIAQNEKALADARGDNYQQEFALIDQLNAKKKEEAETRVAFTQASDAEIASTNKQLLFLNVRRDAIIESIGFVTELTKNKQAEPVQLLDKYGTWFNENSLTDLINKLSSLHTFDQMATLLNEELKSVDLQYTSVKQRNQDMFQALFDLRAADQAIKEEAAKRAKYLSDEEAKRDLDNAEARYDKQKELAKKILDNSTSSEKQRLDALDAIHEAELNSAQAKKDYVLGRHGVTETEANKADVDFNKAKNAADLAFYKESARTKAEFYLKNREIDFQQAEYEIVNEQIKQKAILDNAQAGYDERTKAADEYNKKRKEDVELRFNNEVAKTVLLPTDLQGKQIEFLKSKRTEELTNIDNDKYNQGFQIAETYFNYLNKLIEDNTSYNEIEAKNASTKELLELEDKYKKKLITFKQFTEEYQKLDKANRIAIDEAKVKDDEKDIKERTTEKAGLESKLAGSILSVFMGGGDRPLGGAASLKKSVKKVTDKLNEDVSKYADDQLKLAQDSAPEETKDEKKSREQIKSNYEKAIMETFDFVQKAKDNAFEQEMERLTKLQEAYDKTADIEMAALQRSTLNQKDKNAYEIQLQAQKAANDEEFARQQRKLKHDQAVFDRDVAIGKVIAGTAVAVIEALPNYALAASIGVLGAVELANVIATKIPAYAEGGIHKKDGLALFGEAGNELVKEPNRNPYIATRATVKSLPAGTELIPLYNIPTVSEKPDTTWAQTLYLGKQIQKSKREIKNIFRPKINIDMSKQFYINKILHG